MRTSLPPKRVVSLYMIIVTLLAFKFNVGYGDDDLPASIFFTIYNRLSNSEELVFECKDQSRDLGIKNIPVNEYWIFKLTKFSTQLFRCSFAWGNESHEFDVFEASRDTGSVFNCYIHESGPCVQVDRDATK
ncbi:hypothetical protein PIB30_102078, partial [Stylosanthes scabra]|nr:hypothetical protein [Stylosanthes scabra]